MLITALYFRPSDDRPLTTNEPRLKATIEVPRDVPVKEVSLPTNENVESFTVTVRRPNGELVPVRDGKVYTLHSYLIKTVLSFET